MVRAGDVPLICGLHVECGLFCDACTEMHIADSHKPRPCELCGKGEPIMTVPAEYVAFLDVLIGGESWPFTGKVQVFGGEICARCTGELVISSLHM